MRASRQLRTRAISKRQATKESAPESAKPEGYRSSQTDGFSSIDRVSRRWEHGEHNPFHDMPIVMGFRPNEEN